MSSTKSSEGIPSYSTSGPDALPGFSRMLNDSRLLPNPLSPRFRRMNESWPWIKSVSVFAILALEILPLKSRINTATLDFLFPSSLIDPLALITFVVAATVVFVAYLVKGLASRRNEERHYSKRIQLTIATLEWFAFTVFLCFVAVAFGEVPLSLALLYLWIIYRVGENGSSEEWMFALGVSLVSLLIVDVIAYHLSVETFVQIIQNWLTQAIWISVLSSLLFLLRRHIAWRELAFKYKRILEPTHSEALKFAMRSLLRGIAAKAAAEMRADIVVLYPWDAGRNAPMRPPVVECLPGIEFHNRDYIDTHEIVIRDDNPVWFVIDYYKKNKKPYFSPDVRNDEKIYRGGKNDHGESNFVEREGIVSSIGFPLILDDGAVVGVMWANYRKPTQWDSEKQTQYKLFSEVLSGIVSTATARAAAERAQLMVILHEQVKGSLGLALGQLRSIFGKIDADSQLRQDLRWVEQLILEANHSLMMVIKGEDDRRLLDPGVLQQAVVEISTSELRNYKGDPPELDLTDWNTIPNKDWRILDSQILPTYYVLRMALSNAIRHGKPEHIKLSYCEDETAIRFLVSDDGKGFTVPPHEERNQGGIYLMDQIARQAGGKVDIDSEVGKGTNVHLAFQLERQHGQHQENPLVIGR